MRFENAEVKTIKAQNLNDNKFCAAIIKEKGILRVQNEENPKWENSNFLMQKNLQNQLISEVFGPSDSVRTCGLMVPNCCPNFFPLVYSHFRSFPLGFPYSLTLFEALFPRVPRLTVVIYVVKNHCGARGSSARKTK